MRYAVLAGLGFMLAGCGYVGDPQPPALNIPERVTDLRAVQHAASIRVQFTAPRYSGEKLLLKSLSGIEVFLGSEVYRKQAAPGADVRYEFPAAPFTGQEVSVTVKCLGPTGRPSPVSNAVTLHPIAPLSKPATWTIEGTPGGVRVQWTEVRGGRVYRLSEGEKEPRLLGSGDASYLDDSAEIGKTYSYLVQYTSGDAESEISEPRRFAYADTFPPAVPAGLQGLAGVNAIELNWDRNSEPDLKGYQVYRGADGGAFTKLGDVLGSTSFRDTQLQSGKRYRYRVTAIDQSGNESEPCNPIEILAP